MLMIFRRALAYCLPLSLIAALSACASSCESPKEKEAREEKARSDRHLARLLRTKECVHCYIVDVDLRGHDLRGVKLEDTALHGDLRGASPEAQEDHRTIAFVARAASKYAYEFGHVGHQQRGCALPCGACRSTRRRPCNAAASQRASANFWPIAAQ